PARLRISGRTLIERGGTWTTTKTGAGKSSGRPATTSESASMPPLEAPMTMILFGATGAPGYGFHHRASSAIRIITPCAVLLGPVSGLHVTRHWIALPRRLVESRTISL